MNLRMPSLAVAAVFVALTVNACGGDSPPVATPAAMPAPFSAELTAAEKRQIKLDDARFNREQRQQTAREDRQIARAEDQERRADQRAASPVPARRSAPAVHAAPAVQPASSQDRQALVLQARQAELAVEDAALAQKEAKDQVDLAVRDGELNDVLRAQLAVREAAAALQRAKQTLRQIRAQL